MRVEEISPHGFCSGVKAALSRALRALSASGGREVCCLHELVHNARVVADLEAKGMRFVRSVGEVPEGGEVLFSAHGVDPMVREEAAERGLGVHDATCPFVARVHERVREYAKAGLPVVVVGHADHVEVKGVAGEARAAGAVRVEVVATAAEAAALDARGAREAGVVCQTTISAEAAEAAVEALRGKFGVLRAEDPARVCTATRERQDAVRAFVRGGGDGVLVLGGANSSNTLRLAETARECGAKAFRAGTKEEIEAIDFSGVELLGVTSGASTPEDFFVEAMELLAASANP